MKKIEIQDVWFLLADFNYFWSLPALPSLCMHWHSGILSSGLGISRWVYYCSLTQNFTWELRGNLKVSNFPLFLLDVPHHSVSPFRFSPLCAQLSQNKAAAPAACPLVVRAHIFHSCHTVRDLPGHWALDDGVQVWVCQVPSPPCRWRWVVCNAAWSSGKPLGDHDEVSKSRLYGCENRKSLLRP